MTQDLKDLEEKIKKAHKTEPEQNSDKEFAARQTGMRAGSEFIAYIISGGLVGYAIGHFFGNMPLWLLLMMFLGFGMGIYRASQLMK